MPRIDQFLSAGAASADQAAAGPGELGRQRLAQAGFGLRCGLEVEFHIFRITEERLALADAAMSAIAQACGVSKPLLYHYYRDKEDLLADIALSYIDRLATIQAMGWLHSSRLRTVSSRSRSVCRIRSRKPFCS